MADYVIPRTGKPPVTFAGQLLADVDGWRDDSGREHNRWFELTLYRTEGGRYVVVVLYHSQWAGEPERRDVYHAADAQGVFAQLAAHDPLAPVVGYPAGAAFDAKNARLRAEIRARWDGLITALYDQLPADTFAEVLD